MGMRCGGGYIAFWVEWLDNCLGREFVGHSISALISA